MKFIQSVLALAAIASQSLFALAADPPLPAWYPLEAWQISTLHQYNPYKSPYGTNDSGLILTITNPKRIAAAPAPHASGGGYVVFPNSTARCELHWKTDAATPYGHSSTTCVANADPSDYAHPLWTITLREIHEDLSAPGDHYFSLSFELVHNATIYGSQAYKRMTASIAFRSTTNLQGKCGDDGRCEYNLKDGSSPVLFQPTLQECKTACG
ncbi:hypothetical protein GGS20DRAFT_151128 [Poronia punctata]|nr:hypothetical protein GGS20DRAFT_151128 [Poronia punctata]